MSLSLKLEIKSEKKVLVTNSETNEQKEVTLGFLQKITGDSLLMLAQYKYYELIINAEQTWNKLESFNLQQEKNEKIYIEQKFRDIMNPSPSNSNNEPVYVSSYNTQKSNNKIDKTAIVAAGSGAVTGVLINSAIGNVGVAAVGTAIGVGTTGFATVGAIAGLAAYGVKKALK